MLVTSWSYPRHLIWKQAFWTLFSLFIILVGVWEIVEQRSVSPGALVLWLLITTLGLWNSWGQPLWKLVPTKQALVRQVLWSTKQWPFASISLSVSPVSLLTWQGKRTTEYLVSFTSDRTYTIGMVPERDFLDLKTIASLYHIPLEVHDESLA